MLVRAAGLSCSGLVCLLSEACSVAAWLRQTCILSSSVNRSKITCTAARRHASHAVVSFTVRIGSSTCNTHPFAGLLNLSAKDKFVKDQVNLRVQQWGSQSLGLRYRLFCCTRLQSSSPGHGPCKARLSACTQQMLATFRTQQATIIEPNATHAKCEVHQLNSHRLVPSVRDVSHRFGASAYLVEVEDQVQLADVVEVMVQDLHEQVHALEVGQLVVRDVHAQHEEEARIPPVDHLVRLELRHKVRSLSAAEVLCGATEALCLEEHSGRAREHGAGQGVEPG